MARPQIRFSLGVKIHMSKKLFLAAASMAALAFAGAASAGEISGAFGSAGNFDKDDAYLVASERVVSAARPISGAFVAGLDLDTVIAVGAGAQRDHLVTFTVTGATVENPGLLFDSSGAGNVTASLISNADGVVTFLVTAANDITVEGIALEADLEQEAQASITVAASVDAIIGATRIPVDSGSAVVAAKYAPLLGALKVATANTWQADLPDYKTLDGLLTQTLASGFGFVNTGDFHSDLDDTTLTAGDILDGGVLTIRGPLITENVTVSTIGTIDTDNEEANTAVFDLTAAEAATLAAGAQTLTITQTATADDQEAFRLGTYRASWAPVAKTGFTVPSTTSADAGQVTLEGTNFTAPWVSGTGAATSVIRIGNSNSVATGAVTVRLLNAVKVAGGVATPYTSAAVLEAGSVPANGDLQITSSQLVGAFGDFTRGDIQITINSSDAGISAKMRSTRDGQTFEQSLVD